jgi:hypothetical protein
VYTDPAGSANLPDQIHDFNVHIDSNDVFWMVQVEHDAVKVDFDEGRARLRVRRLEVIVDRDLAIAQHPHRVTEPFCVFFSHSS